MSQNKQQRLKRLVDLRAKEVDRRVKELTLARTRETKLAEELVQARAERQRELDARNERARMGLPAGDWGQAENWLTGLAQKELVAQKQREIASRDVVGARGRVTDAMVEREKIELLMGRLAVEMRKEESRIERKNEDEHASIQGAQHRASGNKRNS
ncbi:MAG TPA: flagellar FliJ family protein [Polyangiaceae bacterium]|jgi:flagellar export protein FliJ|nr:flagellar FliJ family protein [Polyangiaceae bacterium]